MTVIERRAGDWEQAEQHAREMVAASERGHFLPAYHTAPYAWILALRGKHDLARSLAEEGMHLADEAGIGPTFGGHRAVLGLLALAEGDHGRAISYLEPLSSGLTSEIPETGWFRYLADEVEARVAMGNVNRAQSLVDHLAERRGVLLDRAWARVATERCRAVVSSALAEEGAANQAFANAHREHERLNDPFELGRTLLVQGRSDRRFKRRGTSRDHLEAARALFERLGAPQWVARANEELKRVAGRRRSARSLTSTQLRVAELAADGLTNNEIAAAMFLSVNTVQSYLKQVYAELGVRSRTELASRITREAMAKQP
jgi:DNA-binding CsgD family transcriptional regulator